MKKKNILVIAIIILLIALLIPFKINKLKDGGSIEFNSLLYSVTKYHKFAPENSEKEYIDGIKIELLGMELINTINEKEETPIVIEDNQYNSFVGTVLEETTTYMIVKPNEDEEEGKSADKIRINYGTDHYDYLYGIGRKVIIKYTGYIKESYPAQIDTNEILTDGYEEFELTVKKADNKSKTKILNNQELYKNNPDLDLYYYGLSEVNIFVDNKKMSLEDALRSGKMTIDGIIQKANKDFPNAISYDDGGSIEYHYKDYSIIKVHKLDGNRDVYIGVPNMKLNDLKL